MLSRSFKPFSTSTRKRFSTGASKLSRFASAVVLEPSCLVSAVPSFSRSEWASFDKRTIGDCDGSEKVAKPTSVDLEGLGITLLNCMEGRLTDLTVARVRECRASNKVFGLSDPERWSEHKQLVDFVDDIFSAQRKHVVKFTKPVGHPKQSCDPFADLQSTRTSHMGAGIRKLSCR